MKLFLKITAGIVLFLILLVTGLNLYFTDDRLKELVLPRVSEALGSDVQVDRMSITLFSTFPQFGLRMNGFLLPDENSDTVAAFEQLTVAVRLFPLLRNEVAVSRLEIDRPHFYYHVREDSTTNIDFLLSEEPETGEEEREITIQIPRLTIREANIYYADAASDTRIDLLGLNADIGLAYSDLIESSVDAELQSLSVWREGTRYLDGLALQLQQRSVIDMENELLTLAEGTFSIRGFALDLTGTISDWSGDAPVADLQFSSSTDNFGELLHLAPPEFDEHLQGLESRGSLMLEGRLHGTPGGDDIPDFEILAEISDGYLQNPDLQQPIEEIHVNLRATNESVVLTRFSARAAGNLIEASGNLDTPFEENAPFSLRVNGDIDLATISQLYPLDQSGIESISGLLTTNIDASGTLDNPDEAAFDGSLTLRNGELKYADVPRPVENMEVDIHATRNLITIHSASLQASSNRLSVSGTVTDPLAERPAFNLDADLEFDLETIREFYPIDEDTLRLRGELAAQANLQGRADQINAALQEGTITLRNGYIEHRLVNRPLEDVTFIATVSGPVLDIREARFRTGENSLALRGTVENYREEEPVFNLTIDGSAALADVSSYYSLEPWVNDLAGSAVMNLNARGPAGDPNRLALNGSLELEDVFASGDSLALPVTNLRGVLAVRPGAMDLENFFMNYGASDFSLEGSLENYLGFLQDNEDPSALPLVNGTYHSRLLDLDEMIDWDEETEEEPVAIELPGLESRVEARIDTLRIFGLAITDIEGQARTTPEQLLIEEATAGILDGAARGNLAWTVPRPDFTSLEFTGSLDGIQVDAFFREFPILGESSRFEQYLTGEFSAEVDYSADLNEFVLPEITTTAAEGNFGMTRARMQGHPMQEMLAEWLGAGELRSLALDEWTATFTIEESVLTLNDFRLTSENVGIELEGTQHLVTDEIDFTASLLLPSRFRNGLSSVLSGRVVDALTQDDGIISVPVRISGTMENPRITPRESIIEDLLRDTGRDIIRGLFNRN